MLNSTPWLAFCISAFVTAMLVGSATTATAAQTVRRTAKTHVSISAERNEDGTVTATVLFTSSNPRCPNASRWKGHYKDFETDFGRGPEYGIYKGAAPETEVNFAPVSAPLKSPVSVSGNLFGRSPSDRIHCAAQHLHRCRINRSGNRRLSSQAL